MTWLAVAVVVAVVVVLVVRVLRVDGPSVRPRLKGSSPVGRSAEEILDERFARGEISTEELQDRRRTLAER